MDGNFNLLTEIGAFFSKSAAWILSIGVGVIAKVSTELLLKRKLSMMQWIGIMGVSIFGGYMMATWCHSHGWVTEGNYLVPLATLFSEKVMIYITTNYRAIIDRIVDAFFKKKE
jgi:hypothetical protein